MDPLGQWEGSRRGGRPLTRPPLSPTPKSGGAPVASAPPAPRPALTCLRRDVGLPAWTGAGCGRALARRPRPLTLARLLECLLLVSSLPSQLGSGDDFVTYLSGASDVKSECVAFPVVPMSGYPSPAPASGGSLVSSHFTSGCICRRLSVER